MLVELGTIVATGLLLVGGLLLYRLIRRVWEKSGLGERARSRKYRKYR